MNLRPNMGNLNGGIDRSNVEHVCFECGGDFATHLGGLILVQTCWACGGRGRLTDDELATALRIHNHRVEQGLT